MIHALTNVVILILGHATVINALLVALQERLCQVEVNYTYLNLNVQITVVFQEP